MWRIQCSNSQNEQNGSSVFLTRESRAPQKSDTSNSFFVFGQRYQDIGHKTLWCPLSTGFAFFLLSKNLNNARFKQRSNWFRSLYGFGRDTCGSEKLLCQQERRGIDRKKDQTHWRKVCNSYFPLSPCCQPFFSRLFAWLYDDESYFSSLTFIFQFSLLNPSEYFKIGATSGAIHTTGKPFDREEQVKNKPYFFDIVWILGYNPIRLSSMYVISSLTQFGWPGFVWGVTSYLGRAWWLHGVVGGV